MSNGVILPKVSRYKLDFVESLNGRFCDELLKETLFRSLH